MAFKIGFTAKHPATKAVERAHPLQKEQSEPRKSVVQVAFPDRHMKLAYYNDRFDLHPGDTVYVDGKLEGLRGRVVSVSYNFKIKISDYKRVIAVADTCVHGTFHSADSHFVTFEAGTLPTDKVITWFQPPRKEDDEFVCGNDDAAFCLNDLDNSELGGAVLFYGKDYFKNHKVRYLCLNGTKGYAIVEGSHPYEVEFLYQNGEISRLTCSCFCGNPCKHRAAAMLQLKTTLELIETHYADEFARSGYFAAVEKATFFSFAIDGRETGSFTL